MMYNIYFGTIGKTLGVKYQYTINVKTEEEALKAAKNAISSLFYKNEGKYGIPTFSQITKESNMTGVSVEKLYEEHFEDLCRWYAIPTDLDTVPKRKIKRWKL